MQIFVVTLMPDLIRTILENGVIGQALSQGRWSLETVNPRDFTTDVHHTVDDRVFGGSDGMLMLGEPLACAVEKIKMKTSGVKVVHLSPRGRKFDDAMARAWAKSGEPLAFIASRYAGVDERFVEEFCDEEISVGDFVVSGGDLPAAVVIDAVLRHRKGVLGNQASAELDSFSEGLLECRQYTRPREWRGHEIPAILTCGDPILIADWRFLDSLETTLRRRPDLIDAMAPDRVQTVLKTTDEIATRLAREKRLNREDRHQIVEDIEVCFNRVRDLWVKTRAVSPVPRVLGASPSEKDRS